MAEPTNAPLPRSSRSRRSVTGVDLTTFPLTNIDLTNFDVAAMLASDPARVARGMVGATATALRETAYVTVGLTVLGVQRAQSKRHDIERSRRHSARTTS
jgi:hypothetical protein